MPEGTFSDALAVEPQLLLLVLWINIGDIYRLDSHKQAARMCRRQAVNPAR